MTKQPTKLDDVFDKYVDDCLAHSDFASPIVADSPEEFEKYKRDGQDKALREAKQAIYDLIEYVIGEDEDGRDSKVLEGTSCNAACHAIEHRLTKADQRKRAKELL